MSELRARLPLSDDSGLGRGGEPPLATPPKSAERDARLIFRCSSTEKTALLAKAERAGVNVSHLLREALGLVDAKRRRALPRIDPALLAQLGRIGGNLNQVARWLNSSATSGQARTIDALVVAVRLVAIERALSLLATPHALACVEAKDGGGVALVSQTIAISDSGGRS